ncbi:hypothetical protein MNBD_NITROSPINAE02-685 [hydrothermal vent metagenome]|uniref:Uncharacterized protein n=1 Tax=hydrothermal vent metagenome TaxID=652676 RepID=A0A3B1D9K4_9ZZZZ
MSGFALNFFAFTRFRGGLRGLACFFLLLSVAGGGVVEAKNIKVIRKITGSLLTNTAGSSLTQPPYIQVMRSREGLEYLLARFEKIKNRITGKRVKKLRNQLARFNFKKHMLIGIITQPMDNYKITLHKIERTENPNMIDLKVSYRHKIRSLRIPPKKSIHYLFIVIPKSDHPVVLSATQVKETRKNAKPAKVVTVTGRLMQLRNNDLQLVPVVIRRGKKHSYYIRGPQANQLGGHVGKVVTLQGTVSHERVSPYEWDFTVSKVVKIFN